MEISIKSGNADKQQTQCLVLLTGAEGTQKTFSSVDKAAEGLFTSLIERGDLKQAAGQTLLVPVVNGLKAERVLLVALGKEKPKATDAERIFAAIAKTLNSARISDAIVAFDDLDVADRDSSWSVRQLACAIANGSYRFDEHKSKRKDDKPEVSLEKVTLLQSGRKALDVHKQAAAEGTAIAAGMALARDLGNQPGNICTPLHLTEQAKKLAHGVRKLTVKALDEKEMEKLGMHSFLSVSRGSTQEGQLIEMNYKGGKATDNPIVLLGKGITFDTGGISLKPGAGMDEMKFDMCGAASVFGAMKSIVELQLPINVIGLVAAAENMPAGNASKPGDIVTSMSGQTIEILNTDAEGRLVLCDALTYAERYKPKAVVDIATLTGACIMALGHHISALISNNDELADDLLAAGNVSGDKAWRLPMDEQYQKQLDTNFADMANIGGRPAGTITAGCFLSRYAKEFDWAHLDIAGTAWKSGGEKGATGRPVPLLVQYVLSQTNS
ncbi:leucyl aminopeptidase [Sansalvadorimonas sp. 2012CJ34-2]|uniref:Probable cytosol aminopeptidase n=1 Tax=Parendozoicomonas callyspongiae TaxID=2942213 RepID=A0ABT0PET8_9GAMM|nr:leucyl aminopeptidase [Sansalvadorimonas sp. 2012CJ34-2]MCL6269053.1 leucyl aminopeptidase [Sansalvadorimonas sp. 2012CJ34-2]